MDKDSWLDNSNKRMNAELYESTNNKSNQTTLGKNNATTPKKAIVEYRKGSKVNWC